MGVRAVIVQPCFFPWRGYFDLLARGDRIIALDTVEYSPRSWYNRNRIILHDGPSWITVPVFKKGAFHSQIQEIKICNENNWRWKILTKLQHAYGKYPCFGMYFPGLEQLMNKEWIYLADLSIASVEWGFKMLGRPKEIVRASEIGVDDSDPVKRLISLCRAVGADHYLSGPSAKDYIGDDVHFCEAGITLEWMEYNYPQYQQVRFSDIPLSILDLLFNVGDKAAEYIWKE